MKTLDMPSFGADMAKGKVIEWLVKPGDRVKKGDLIALIETSKGVIEMEVFEPCQIESYLLDLDVDVPVGTPLIQLAEPAFDDSVDTEPAIKSPSAITESGTDISPEPVKRDRSGSFAAPAPSQRIRATPAARAYAAQHGIDLTNQKITRDRPVELKDLRQSRSVPTHGEHAETFDPDMMRNAIGQVVSRSKREIPHYYLSHDNDLGLADAWVKDMNLTLPVEQRLLNNAPLLCAIAQSLKKFPELNGYFQQKQFQPSDHIHLAIAIRLRGKGLITPALLDADQYNPVNMMSQFKNLVERAKYGGLRQSEMQGATVTVSNIGDRGVNQIFGVIFPPQVALIGIGQVQLKPVCRDGAIVARPLVNITLSADHRVSDGHLGARFLNEISKRLQKPARL